MQQHSTMPLRSGAITLLGITAVLLVLISPGASECPGTPPEAQSSAERLRVADLVVYGKITSFTSDLAGDSYTTTVQFDLYCALVNKLQSNAAADELEKDRISFQTTYDLDVNCAREQELGQLNANDGKNVIVTLVYNPNNDVKFQVNQINAQSAIYALEDDPNANALRQDLRDLASSAGFKDIEAEECSGTHVTGNSLILLSVLFLQKLATHFC